MKTDGRATALQGTRVLVVNDTQEILELFDDILSEMGFEVVQMSYAPRELARIHEVEPDLIVLDFVFGDRELLGWQLLQKIRMDRRLESIPVVVCSAALQMLQELEGYLTQHHVVAVVKPFTVAQLEEAVLQALGHGDHRAAHVSRQPAAQSAGKLEARERST